MKRPLLLDLFCGGGGASMGYYRAGFDVVGVDVVPQKHYPFEFIQADVMEWFPAAIESGCIDQFAVIHASPPCQTYSVTASMHDNGHPDLVAPVRDLLIESRRPYVIENVPGAPLVNPLLLCGTMFPGLRVIRHRLFECCPAVWFPPAQCCHWGKATGSGSARKEGAGTNSIEGSSFDFVTVVGNDYLAGEGREAMGIDWLPKSKLSQAIPPAYTHWLGEQLKEVIS